MNINEFTHMMDFISVWIRIDGYEHLGRNKYVCSGDVTIVGTRIRPNDILNYGSIEETMLDFSLTKEEVLESLEYVKSK